MKTNQLPHTVALARSPLLAFPVLLLGFATSSHAGDAAAALVLEPVQLEKLEVRADRAHEDAYKADRTRTGTKTDTALQDIPQSITVVTSRQILDQQMLSLADLVRYVPGVSSHQGENNRDQIIFRGNSSSADFFVNGVRDDAPYRRDLYNLDRVEVLRGPNAMVFGRGGGGGVINRSTKEADFSPLREVTFQAGSFDLKRATVDFDQPFNAKAAVRLNGVVENSGSFRRFVDCRRLGLNPTLTLLPSKQTKVTLAYEYLHDTRTADRGITSFLGRPADVPIETFYGDPAQSRVSANVNLVTGALEYRGGNLALRNCTMFGDYRRGYQNFVPGAATADKAFVALTAYNNATKRRNIFSQTDATYTVTTGAARHLLLGGFELGRQRTANFRNTGYFSDTATSVSVPFANPLVATPVTWRQSGGDADNRLKTDLAAAYVQDQIEFSRRWQAVVGARFDSFDLQYRNNRNGDCLGRRDQRVSPRAGLVFKPAAKVSVYGSYSVSFLPSSGDQFSSLTTITQQVQPEKFSNLEVGTKWDLPDNFALTAALYQLDRTHTRATDPNDPTRIVQTGSQRSRGFELGWNGRFTRAWTVSGGYAYQDALIRSATTAASVGATVPQVPRHNFSLWNKRQFTRRFSAAIGIVHRSAIFAAIDNSVMLPGYTEVGAALYYLVSEHWRLQANVENLLNKNYYLNADGNTSISPGPPFALRVGVTTRF